MTLRLAYRPPFAWEQFLSFLTRRALAGVEEIRDGAYRRTVLVHGTVGLIEARPEPEHSRLALTVPLALAPAIPTLVSRTRRLFDLDADPLAIDAVLRKDPRLARSVRRTPGLRVPGAWDAFETAARVVLGQQVTVAGATTVASRLAERCGTSLGEAASGALCRTFPEASAVATADLARLGVPGARVRTLQRLAAGVASGALQLDSPEGLPDALERLLRVPGIGAWTAALIALRVMGEPDALPAADLGLRRVLGHGGVLASPAEVLDLAEAWRPFRGYAALRLWAEEGDA